MGLFRKKCEHCRSKIDKGSGVSEKVKVVGFTGLHEKHFCCNGCLGSYEKELNDHLKNSKKCGGCCG